MESKDVDWERLGKYGRKIVSRRRIPCNLRDDLAQEAVIHVHTVLHKYDPAGGASVYTWAYRVMDRFVGQAKRKWFTEVKHDQKMRDKWEFVARIRRHRVDLSRMLKPATLRVASVLLANGWIDDAEIAVIAGVRSAGSVRAHISLLKKDLELVENQ